MTLTKSLTNYFIERENQWVKARDTLDNFTTLVDAL